MIVGAVGRRLSILFLILLTCVALYLSFIIAEPFITPVLTAGLLAIAMYPLFSWALRYTRNRTLTALLGVILVLLALVVPTILTVNALAQETRELYTWLSQRSSGEGGWNEYLNSILDRPLFWLSERTGMSYAQLRQTALDRLQTGSAEFLNWAKSFVVNLTGTVVDTFIMLFTLFFLLRDGERIRDRIGSIVPLEPHRYTQLVNTISESIGANMYGVVAVSLAQGTLGAIGYTIAGLPSVMLWSVATALFSMVPLAGAATVWSVAVIYLLISAHWGKAIFMLAWGAGVISMADNIVRPFVLSGKVKLNTLLIFFSLLGGVRAFGVIGLFVGPIIISVAMALLKILDEERRAWEAGHMKQIRNPEDRTSGLLS